MKKYYEFFCPVKVISGHMALEHLPFEISSHNAKRPMLITSKGMEKKGLLKPIQDAFATTNIEITYIFDHVLPDSSLEIVQEAAKIYKEKNCDAIIAIGGGSVIDTAKAMNILVSENGTDLLQYSGANNLPKPLKPLIVIPTTAGTGSEVTMVAVIADQQKKTKLAFSSPYLMPNIAILDPRMTQTLPANLTALTAMDALTHAVEAYTCLASNPLSDAYATAAIQKITQNLFYVLQHPQDSTTRLELMQASTMAGIAFSNSMVGLVHSLGHALGAVTHLPHGLCMSLFLPYVLDYNQSINAQKISDLLLPLAGADVFAQTPPEHRAEQAINTIFSIRDRLFEMTQLPRTLRETGQVTKEQFEEIAKKTLNDGSILYNPKEANLDDVYTILEKVW